MSIVKHAHLEAVGVNSHIRRGEAFVRKNGVQHVLALHHRLDFLRGNLPVLYRERCVIVLQIPQDVPKPWQVFLPPSPELLRCDGCELAT